MRYNSNHITPFECVNIQVDDTSDLQTNVEALNEVVLSSQRKWQTKSHVEIAYKC